jgi:hypothetical protein
LNYDANLRRVCTHRFQKMTEAGIFKVEMEETDVEMEIDK